MAKKDLDDMMEFISGTPMFNQNSLEQEDLTWMFGNLKKDQMLRVLYTQTPLKKGEMVTYCFKIQLRGITKPPVWRKVEVPSQFTFGAFHLIIQAAFGWFNYHLHKFALLPYRSPDEIFHKTPDDWNEPWKDERKLTLGELFGTGETIQKLCYVYDFGDDWIHDIKIEKVIAEKRSHAICTKGKGACPYEDCGGPYAWQALKAMGVEPYKDYDDDFDPTDIDPNYFDLDEVADEVASIKAKDFEDF